MYKYNFVFYNEKAEEPNGDYWKFLDASPDEIVAADIFLNDMKKVISSIKNAELKARMIAKIKALMLKEGIDFRLAGQLFSDLIDKSQDIFSSAEVKEILEHEFNTRIIGMISNQESFAYNYASISFFLDYAEKALDSNWRDSIIIKIIEVVKSYPNKSGLIKIIEGNRFSNMPLYNKLIRDYYDYFPTEYKKYLEMNQDKDYVHRKSLQFMHEDIDIGIDPRIKIGVEIEANKDYPIEINLGNQNGFSEYVVGTDATVPNGNEVSTTIPFHNTREEVAKFCAVCESMTEMGYHYDEVSNNASGQINLGLDYLDSKEAILNFYEIYGNVEELLYYISSEEGQLFRQSVYYSSRIKPISEIVNKRVLDESLSREDVIKLFNSKLSRDDAFHGLRYKENSVCLRGTHEGDYRFEFRIPNGGSNYRTWIDNIRLYGKMMEVAKRLVEISKKVTEISKEDVQLTEEEETLLGLKIDLQNDSLPLEEKLEILMDLLFKDEKTKQIYYDRYNATIKKIKETHSDHYERYFINSTAPAFAEVEFQEQYHSRVGPNYEGVGVYSFDEFDENGNPIEPGRRR